MTCTKPIRINGLLVPCRHCIACRVAHTREWSMRLVNELDYWNHAAFVTLTYDDEHLPQDNGLHKRDLQLFFKRLRKATLGDYKYYAAGEYGGRFGRPHYHIIIFGLDVIRRSDPLLNRCWPYGFNYSGNVTYDSCRYVAQYCIDKLSGPMAEEAYGNRERPFQLQSKGIGKRWMEDHQDDLREGKNLTFHGRPIGLPAYYRRKLDLKDVVRSKAAERSAKTMAEIALHLSDIPQKEKLIEAKRIEVISRDQRDIDNLVYRNIKLNSYSKT